MNTIILTLWIWCLINFVNNSYCANASCLIEDIDYVTVGENITFHFLFVKESYSNFIKFQKDGVDIAYYELTEISKELFTRLNIYEVSLTGRITVNRTDDGNTTIILSNVHISDNGTYTVLADYGNCKLCRRVLVIGMEKDKERDVINEGTTITYRGYPTLSAISSHKDWNITCEYLLGGKQEFTRSVDYKLLFLVHDDWMIIPRVSRDLHQKTISYQCSTNDDDTFEVEQVLSVNYTISERCNSDVQLIENIKNSSTTMRETTLMQDTTPSNVEIDDVTEMSLKEKLIIGGYIIAVTIVTSISVVCVMGCCKKCRQGKRAEQMNGLDSSNNNRNRRSHMYIHARGAESIYDLPFTCDRDSIVRNGYLEMEKIRTPSSEFQESSF